MKEAKELHEPTELYYAQPLEVGYWWKSSSNNFIANALKQLYVSFPSSSFQKLKHPFIIIET